MDELVNAEHHKSVQSHMNTEDIVFGYCTEFMVSLKKIKWQSIRLKKKLFEMTLSELGDSLLVIADEELVKVHIHSEQPGNCLKLWTTIWKLDQY